MVGRGPRTGPSSFVGLRAVGEGRCDPSAEMTETFIDLLRHGEPRGGRMYRGQRDDPLSERGWAQMRAAVGTDCPWQAVVSSPLMRCSAFAVELAQRHGLPLRVDPDLREVGFGSWEGSTREELEARTPGMVERFYQDPVAHRPAGAEPLHQFQSRVRRAWERILAESGAQPALVVAHAGVIRIVVAEVLGTPLERLYRLQVPNAGLTRIAVGHRAGALQPCVLFHGRTPEVR